MSQSNIISFNLENCHKLSTEEKYKKKVEKYRIFNHFTPDETYLPNNITYFIKNILNKDKMFYVIL